MLLPVTAGHLAFLRQVALPMAAFPPGVRRPEEPLALDEVARYLDGWGRQGDLGLVAVVDGRPVGAAWIRTFAPDRPGYGFVGADVPELTVAVVAAHRGQGLGGALVLGVLDLAAVHAYRQVSLSVAEAVNPGAAQLYRSVGFADVASDADGSTTMVAATAPRRPTARAHRCDELARARSASAFDGPALVRLREMMFDAAGNGGHPTWVSAMLRRWSSDGPDGPLLAAVVDGRDGRPVASAMAEVSTGLPAPGLDDGRFAWFSSVATDPAWRGLGAAGAAVSALLEQIDELGIDQSRLAATVSSQVIYQRLGFRPSAGPLMMRDRPTR